LIHFYSISIYYLLFSSHFTLLIFVFANTHVLVAKEREKLERKAGKPKASTSQTPSAATSRTASPVPPVVKKKVPKLLSNLPPSQHEMDQQQMDMAYLNLEGDADVIPEEEPPKMTLAREKVLEEARAFVEADREGRSSLNLVVIG